MSTPVSLDAPLGEHFTFRDFIECGETWARLNEEGAKVPNVPVEAETLQALRTMCLDVLEPVMRHFGVRPVLTYGFACPALTKHIHGRICPEIDQHAGSELKRNGTLICARRGIAVDFSIPGVSSKTVAAWVEQNTPFDRLYFYGDDRPIHVSVGPEQSRDVVHMVRSASGRLIPRRIKKG